MRAIRSQLGTVRGRAFGGLAAIIAALTLAAVLVLGHPQPGATATADSPLSGVCATGVQDASVGGAMGIEQSVAVDPQNTNTVLIGSIGRAIASSPVVSHQCGLTGSWTNPGPSGDFSSCTGDQSVAWDHHGNAYFSCDGTEVYHSSDGGDTWGPAVTAASPADNMGDAIDRPWLAVDNSGGPRDGTVYLVYESFFTNPLGWVFVRVSTDHGATWSGPYRVDDASTATQSNQSTMTQADPRNFPAVGADGTLYVVYAAGFNPFTLNQQSPITLVVARSTDGGHSWTHVNAATNVTRNSSPEDETEIISSLAADPSPQRAGHLALVWANQINGESRILFEDSVDGGRTWTKPTDIDDDPSGNGDNHDHPQVVFLPDGQAVVVWRDRRCCGGGYSGNYQIWARPVSIDSSGAISTGTTVQVTQSPQAPNSSSSTNEYIGASAGPEGLNVAWDQVVSGTPESVYRRLPLSDFATPGGSGNGAASSSSTTSTTLTPPGKPKPKPKPTGRPKPKRRFCTRTVTVTLPIRGERPDIDGDSDDHWKVVDVAVISGHKVEREVFPKHRKVPRTVRVTLTGRGTVKVQIVEELGRKGDSEAVTREYGLPVCTRGRVRFLSQRISIAPPD